MSYVTSYSYHEITVNRNKYREVFRLYGTYGYFENENEEEFKYDRFPIILFQSLVEPWIFVVHIEFGFDATRKYHNLGHGKVHNPNPGHVFMDGADYGTFESFLEHILSHELFYEDFKLERKKAFRLFYYAFRNHLFFGDKFSEQNLKIKEQKLIED